jgi:hypothetical protein
MIADPSLPEGWGSTSLQDLLSKPECEAVWEIIKSEKDSISRVRKLTQYFAARREALEKKGILPEFLAYAVEYNVQLEAGKQFGSRQEGK